MRHIRNVAELMFEFGDDSIADIALRRGLEAAKEELKKKKTNYLRITDNAKTLSYSNSPASLSRASGYLSTIKPHSGGAGSRKDRAIIEGSESICKDFAETYPKDTRWLEMSRHYHDPDRSDTAS